MYLQELFYLIDREKFFEFVHPKQFVADSCCFGCTPELYEENSTVYVKKGRMTFPDNGGVKHFLTGEIFGIIQDQTIEIYAIGVTSDQNKETRSLIKMSRK